MVESFNVNSSEDNNYWQIEGLVTLPYDLVQQLFVLKERANPQLDDDVSFRFHNNLEEVEYISVEMSSQDFVERNLSLKEPEKLRLQDVCQIATEAKQRTVDHVVFSSDQQHDKHAIVAVEKIFYSYLRRLVFGDYKDCSHSMLKTLLQDAVEVRERLKNDYTLRIDKGEYSDDEDFE